MTENQAPNELTFAEETQIAEETERLSQTSQSSAFKAQGVRDAIVGTSRLAIEVHAQFVEAIDAQTKQIDDLTATNNRIEDELVDARSEIRTLTSQLVATKLQHEREIDDLKSVMEREQNDMRFAHEAEVAKLVREHTAKIKDYERILLRVQRERQAIMQSRNDVMLINTSITNAFADVSEGTTQADDRIKEILEDIKAKVSTIVRKADTVEAAKTVASTEGYAQDDERSSSNDAVQDVEIAPETPRDEVSISPVETGRSLPSNVVGFVGPMSPPSDMDVDARIDDILERELTGDSFGRAAN